MYYSIKLLLKIATANNLGNNRLEREHWRLEIYTNIGRPDVATPTKFRYRRLKIVLH